MPSPAGATVQVNEVLAEAPVPSVAVTVTVLVPAVVGVPVMVPAEEIDRPAGSPVAVKASVWPLVVSLAETGTDTAVPASSSCGPGLEARTLARLAAQYAGRGVIGFGLSNDERRGTTADFAPAFRIATRAGLLSDPHGGELCGPANVRACLDELRADRIGHGIRAAEDNALVRRLAAGAVTLEVCPSSNVALGVFGQPSDVPLPRLLEAGVQIALGADDPLLFGSRLTAQYELAASALDLSEAQLAELARMSVRGSVAPGDVRARLLAGIDAWVEAGRTSERGTDQHGLRN
jgi:adenosine deaminase